MQETSARGTDGAFQIKPNAPSSISTERAAGAAQIALILGSQLLLCTWPPSPRLEPESFTKFAYAATDAARSDVFMTAQGGLRAALEPAWSLLAGLNNQNLVARAKPVLEQLLDSGKALGRFRAPAIFVSDGALNIEWIRKDRRLGLSFADSAEESGWFFVSTPRAGGAQESGYLDSLELDRLVALFVSA